jgi:hypothetical protein
MSPTQGEVSHQMTLEEALQVLQIQDQDVPATQRVQLEKIAPPVPDRLPP